MLKSVFLSLNCMVATQIPFFVLFKLTLRSQRNFYRLSEEPALALLVSKIKQGTQKTSRCLKWGDLKYLHQDFIPESAAIGAFLPHRRIQEKPGIFIPLVLNRTPGKHLNTTFLCSSVQTDITLWLVISLNVAQIVTPCCELFLR